MFAKAFLLFRDLRFDLRFAHYCPAAPPIMLRIGTHSLNPIPNPNPNPNPTQEHTVTLGLQLSVLVGHDRTSDLDLFITRPWFCKAGGLGTT